MPSTLISRIHSSLLFLLILVMGQAQAQETNVVTGFRPLFRAALVNADGHASARLEGAMAQQLRAKFPGLTDIRAEVKILRRFEQDGCARFALTISPAGLPDIPPNMTMTINWCRDGSIPGEGAGNGTSKGEGG